MGVDLRQILADLDIPIEQAVDSGMGTSLGGWVPGAVAVTSPQNTGILIPAGSQIVLQMHYNLYTTLGSDQSTMALEVVPFTDDMRVLEAPALLAPVEIPCPDGTDGPACEREVGAHGCGQSEYQ